MIHTRYQLIALFITAILMNTALIACSNPSSRGFVRVLGLWTGPEEINFKQVLNSFTQETGVQVDYQGTRALSEVLASDVQEGNPPDIAILFSPGELGQYQRDGKLHNLDTVIKSQGSYSKQWLDLQRLGTHNLYGVVVKANLKSIIWFNPHQVPKPDPHTWDQLVALGNTVAGKGGTPWCMGMDSTPTPGWPGTDWIEDILLHQFGTEIYRQWAYGDLPWTAPQVKKAWQDWGAITATVGRSSALLTDWQDAGRPMFTDPPGCFLEHEPSFVTVSYQNYDKALKPGVDFDFFRFPDSGSRSVFEVSADMAVMFKDTYEARRLIEYLATDEAQKIWPRIGGGTFSVNRNVTRNVYRDDASKHIAQELTTADTLCYDASDLMPAEMRDAFNHAVLEYLSDPQQLDPLLDKLDRVRKGIPPTEWRNIPCGQ